MEKMLILMNVKVKFKLRRAFMINQQQSQSEFVKYTSTEGHTDVFQNVYFVSP